MAHLALADATDLTNWANRIESQSTLPLLLRRLVHATTHDLKRVGFPAGDAVQGPGWGGVVTSPSGSAFVPAGHSVWEMGTNQDIKRKADSDYQKRSDNPLGVDPNTSTFVFVTPRRWPAKDTWVEARKEEGRWYDIVAYDADTLEEWLAFAPSVHLWLSNRLGKFSEDATDLSTSWLDWSECTAPTLSPQLVLAGRTPVREAIEGWLDGADTPSLTIRAESRDEAQAVFAASLMAMPTEESIKHLSRAVVVRTLQAWHQLAANRESLLLVPTFDVPEAIARATRAGHRVIVTLGREAPPSGEPLDVPPVASDEARAQLQESGMPEGQARELAALARRSLMAFRRKIARNPELQAPAWSRPDIGPRLVPILLAGAWNANLEGDRQVLADLASASYSDVAQVLTRWSTVPDPPFRAVGETWYLVSKEDAWQLLSRYLTSDHLARLEAVVLRELGMTDPRFELPPEERWWATRQVSISGHLREGLAESLVILASKSAEVGSTTGRAFVQTCIWKLLKQGRSDWRLWASLPLVLLAEAAPEAFLDAVEHGLSGEVPVLMNLFESNGDPLFSSSPHTKLLWALEVVAWSPEYLGQATQLLGKLARLDPGGRTANRPRESLMQIYLFWHAQTSASFEQRIQVLERLRRWEPEVAWNLFVELLPSGNTIGMENPMPRWRDWAPSVRPNCYSPVEYRNGVCTLIRFMLEDAGKNPNHWVDLISNLADLPDEQRVQVIERLKAFDVLDIDDEAREKVWNELRSFISRHRSYSEAGWALGEELLGELERVYHRFEPHSPVLRASWLFDGCPDLLEGREQEWEVHQRLVAELRQEAVRNLAEGGGLAALVELAQVVTSPWDLGVALGLSDLLDTDDEDALMRAYLAHESQQLAVFARGFVSGRVRRSAAAWANETMVRIWERLTPEQQAQFLLQLPEDQRTLDLAESSPATEGFYWAQCTPHFVEAGQSERAIRKLLEHGRPFTAIKQLNFLASRPAPPSAGFIAEALRTLVTAEPKDDRASHTFAYHLGQLLTRLEQAPDVSEDDLASLEWALLPALESYGRERPPRTLHRRLGRDPNFFVEVVSLLYKPEGAEAREPTPDAIARAHNSFDLLNSWKAVPGLNEAGDGVDVAYLLYWVARARAGLADAKRLAVGDIIIGGVFAHGPIGTDGAWPHEAVREVIETARSADLEQGFRTGIFNKRGFYSKRLDEGGAQERKLAERYNGYAEALRGTAPRTAASLRRVAEGYLSDARKEDHEAELREDLGL